MTKLQRTLFESAKRIVEALQKMESNTQEYEIQRAKFLSLYNVIEESGLEEEYLYWRESNES